MSECVRQGASLHDKKVVPILRILGTDATYYLLLSTFIYFFSPFSLKHMEAKPPNKSRFNGSGWKGGLGV